MPIPGKLFLLLIRPTRNSVDSKNICELELWFSGAGLVKFEFSGNSNIVSIGQAIGSFVL